MRGIGLARHTPPGRPGRPDASRLGRLLAVGVLLAALLAAAAMGPVPPLAAGAAAATLPEVPPRPAGPQARPIVDLADVLTPEQEARLDARLGHLYRTTGITAGVLTVRSIAPETIDGYTQRVFDTWQLGRAGKDDGLLLVVAVDDRRIKLEPGYALEPLLPDGRIGELLDRYALPSFRAGNYGEGIVAVMKAASAILANEAPPDPPRPVAGRTRRVDPGWLLLLFFLAVALARWLGGGGSGGMRRRISRGHVMRRSRFGGPIIIPGGFGGFGGGSGGGGWGGFGGRSGGGGASRGW